MIENLESRLKKFLFDEEVECVEKVKNLIKDDAPKNKFSIVTGRLNMILDLKDQLDRWDKEIKPN